MASTYLTRTQGTPTSDDIGTYSFWMKRGTLDKNNEYIVQNYVDAGNYGYFRFKSDNQFQHYSSGGGDWERRTNRVFRDVTAWYHIVLRIDTTQSTASDRVRLYVNGVQETSFSTETNASQSGNNKIFASGGTLRIGYVSSGTATYFDGCLSHFHYCDGYSYAPTEFGSTDSTTGEWKINTSPSVTYGNQGFFIFKDGTNLSGSTVQDQSGNGNNFTVGGGTLTKTEDNPSNVFATMNPLSSLSTFSQGNNRILFSSGTGYQTSTSTLGMVSGKFYAEMKIQIEHNNYPGIGIAATNSLAASKMDSDWLGEHSDTYGYYLDGVIYNNGSTVASGLTTFTTGDIVGLALDLDSPQNTLKYYKNGSLIYTLNINTNSNGYMFGSVTQQNTANAAAEWNFGNGVFGNGNVSSAGTNASGNGIFEYDVPTGYTALSTKGLNE